VPSSQARPGFLITAPPPVLIPAELGALAVWIQNPKKKKSFGRRDRWGRVSRGSWRHGGTPQAEGL